MEGRYFERFAIIIKLMFFAIETLNIVAYRARSKLANLGRV
jgi:hypothetical protein